MGFMDKLKKNTTDLGKISKSIVEQNKLKLQVSKEKKKANVVKQKIGEKMYQHFLSNYGVPEDILLDCQRLEKIFAEIEELDKEIKKYSDEINSYSDKDDKN